jgi:hypothetical protein
MTNHEPQTPIPIREIASWWPLVIIGRLIAVERAEWHTLRKGSQAQLVWPDDTDLLFGGTVSSLQDLQSRASNHAKSGHYRRTRMIFSTSTAGLQRHGSRQCAPVPARHERHR